MGPQVVKSMLDKGLEFFGLFYGHYRAHVVDNEDDLGLDRIKVIVPAITGAKTNPRWAYPSYMSGDDYGVSMVPQKGDIVYITCERGNRKSMIWRHGHYVTGQTPSELRGPNVYGFKSPKGHLVKVDDDEETITIETINAELLKLSNALAELDATKVEVGSGATRIDLGSGVLEPAVKGTTNAAVLNGIITQMVALAAVVSTFGAAQQTAALSLPIFAPLAAAPGAAVGGAAPITGALGAMPAQVEQTKSLKVNVE